MSKIKTLKPLDFGNVLTTEEALAQLEGYVPEKLPENQPPINPPQPPGNIQGSESISGNYILMAKTNTYALGVQALRDVYARGECPGHLTVEIEGSKLVRPLTFKENLEARINDYETLTNSDGSERTKEERLKLFTERWLDSCTGVAYKAETTKFKLIPVCRELVTIDKDFNDSYLTVDYNSIAGVELDSSQEGVKYRPVLTQAEVLEHPAWLTAVEEDRTLLENYTQIVFSELKEKYNRDTGMGFWVRTENITENELRALFVDYLNDNSDANGNNNLSSNGSFLQVAPPKTP